jgi:hypothetical protein
MAVDKILEIDLTKLTPESLRRIDDQVGNIIDALEDQGKRAPVQQQARTQAEKEEGLSKVFGKSELSNLVQAGSNPTAFILSGVTKLIPIIGTALLVTGVIAEFVQKVNNFQAKFVDNVDDRINIFRGKEEQARIQAGLTNVIITSAAGSAEPRDAYNTFREFNENQQRIENEFQITNTTGVD